MTVIDYLEKTVTIYPDKPAVIDRDGRYSFAELHGFALSMAEIISQRLNGNIHMPIMVYLPKGKECIAAFLGIIYSGNIYTVTDIRFPFPKVNEIINIFKPMLYISDEKNAQILRENGIANEKIVMFEDIICVESDYPYSKSVSRIIDTDPVYVLFTSGSTGVPKGVTITHRCICDFIDWVSDYLEMNDSDVIGNQVPLYFDMSVLDIYACIKNGSTLYIIPEEYFAFPMKLVQVIAETGINFIFWVPSILAMIANQDVLSSADCPCLKKIIFAGEVMQNKHLNYWRNKIPDALYANLYGPTEITVICIAYIVDRTFENDEPLPIGFPCTNTDILLLDDANNLIKTSEKKGEICVRGSSLSPGYWDDPQKTDEVFCQNPLNVHYPEKIYRTGDIAHYNGRGELMYDGRKDLQIKHMGHRIELGEIETAASSLDGVTAVCVDYDSIKQEIVMFYSGDADEKPLRISLLKLLAKYMVPTRYIRLAKLPYNDSGKIDRKKLRKEQMIK